MHGTLRDCIGSKEIYINPLWKHPQFYHIQNFITVKNYHLFKKFKPIENNKFIFKPESVYKFWNIIGRRTSSKY